MPVSDVYPKVIPDLFGAKPVILTGKYGGNGRGVIRLKGKMSGRDFVREIPVDFSATDKRDVLATLWARTRVDELMAQDFNGAQQGTMKEDLKQTITQLGLDYRLMTQFTSFVAVEEMIVTDGGQPRRIDVPVEVPEGVNRMMVGGDADPEQTNFYQLRAAPGAAAMSVGTPARVRASGAGGGSRTKVAPMPPNSAPVVTVQASPAARVDSSIVSSIHSRVVPASPLEQLRLKTHRSVFAVVERLRKREILPSADEGKFIRNGKAELQVWLTDKSDENLAKLKELGFEVMLDAKTSKVIIGRLSIDKLEALAALKFVKYVSPQVSK